MANTFKKYEILAKQELNSDTTLMEFASPLIAKKAKAGQFIILRVDEDGERIPLTIADTDSDRGSITIIYQKVGATTMALDCLNVGDCLCDLVGPLGVPTHIDGLKKVAVVGGGLGCAIAHPIAKALVNAGAEVDLIAGFRTENLIIIKDLMERASNKLHICTDDGSCGTPGFVTDKLKSLIDSGEKYDCVFAIGPLIMMKFVCKLTKTYDIPTMISMNPIMVDGTGMCGCCRVTVGDEVKFACVDGPDFDGHLVDFDEVIARNASYKQFETEQKEQHVCRLRGRVDA